MIIYDDTAARVELEAGLLRNLAVGANADREDDNVSAQDCAAAEFDIYSRALVLEGGNAVCKVQTYTFAADIVVQDFGHLGIYGSHDLVCSLDDGNAEAGVMEIFRHFKADETASDDDRALCPEPADQFADVVGIRNGPKGQNARRINSRNAGTQRGGAGRYDELVIGFDVFFAGYMIFDKNGLIIPVNGEGLIADPHIDVIAAAHDLDRGDKKRFSRLYHIAHMIRQTAVGVRNESPALEQDDLRIFVKPAKSGRASRAGSDASDYKCFAHIFSFR